MPAPHVAEYKDWLNRGRNAGMEYLAKHVALKENPDKLLPGVRSVIAVSLNYYQPIESNSETPRIARYALGRDYHRVIRGKLKQLGAWIESAVPGSISRACVDSAPIFERDYAHLAGLGWFGKNTMLIDSRRGSWFFLGILLTTAEFDIDAPSAGGCGTCTACVDACPTGAILFDGGRWQVDAGPCISYQTIEKRDHLSVQTSGWTFGCDVCQEVCPFNTPRPSQPLRGVVTHEIEFLTTRRWPSLTELAQIDYESWDLLTQGSAVRRAGYEGLKRNAQANLDSIERAVPLDESGNTDL